MVVTAATAHHDLLALAALFGYRRDSAMSAQGVIIPLGDGVGSLREEIGRDQIPESWYREQQTDIAVCPGCRSSPDQTLSCDPTMTRFGRGLFAAAGRAAAAVAAVTERAR